MAKSVVLRAFAGPGPTPASRLGYARWCAALAATCCICALGGLAAPAVADQSVIDLMNKTSAQKASAQKAVAQSAPAAQAPAPKPAARPKSTAKAPAKPSAPGPRAEEALLAPQGAPDCAFRGPVSSPITAEELRMKLDYEAQCYRQAEAIVRARLQQLQEALGKTIKASGQNNSLVSNR